MSSKREQSANHEGTKAAKNTKKTKFGSRELRLSSRPSWLR